MPKHNAHCHLPSGARTLVLAQASVLALSLAACALLPRWGKPMLLIGLGQQGTQEAIAFARQHHIAMLGAGRLPGSIVVEQLPAGRGATMQSLDALRHGILPLAAPEMLCATPLNQDQTNGVSPAPMPKHV